MIFDLLTSPQGHQFYPRMKILLAFCSAHHSCRFDMPHGWHDHVSKNIFLTPWAPPAHQSTDPGAWHRGQNKNPVWYVLNLSFVRTHTKFGTKIFEIDFEIDFVIEIKWYLTFWPHPKVTSLTLGWKCYLHSVLLVIPIDLICHMTMFEKKKIGSPGHPQWGMTQATEWKSRLICFVTFICENTHKVWHKNLWNWFCNWNLIFDLLTLPQSPRGRGQNKLPLPAPFMWVTHTPNLVKFRPMV